MDTMIEKPKKTGTKTLVRIRRRGNSTVAKSIVKKAATSTAPPPTMTKATLNKFRQRKPDPTIQEVMQRIEDSRVATYAAEDSQPQPAFTRSLLAQFRDRGPLPGVEDAVRIVNELREADRSKEITS